MKTHPDLVREQAQNFLLQYNPVPLEKDILALMTFILSIEKDCLLKVAEEIDLAMRQSEEIEPRKHHPELVEFKNVITLFLRRKAAIRQIAQDGLTHSQEKS